MITAIESAVGGWARTHFPQARAEQVDAAVDMVARLSLSYLVLPPQDPRVAAQWTEAAAKDNNPRVLILCGIDRRESPLLAVS